MNTIISLLQTLYCFTNKLTTLPSDMEQLRVLDCSDNHIEYIPPNIIQLFNEREELEKQLAKIKVRIDNIRTLISKH